jgi:hypothetical protein
VDVLWRGLTTVIILELWDRNRSVKYSRAKRDGNFRKMENSNAKTAWNMLGVTNITHESLYRDILNTSAHIQYEALEWLELHHHAPVHL